ncbi:MAG TPA: NADH-quinone oxidoreductase subunit NuoN [Vitreimonas sp.]|uniref:NADH-quinone oxidoreductase subunit NuoN n=1 Tax=Vitreimonas sp. TaxID=3069702 RepID=UPI002D71F098|nr:NADH-quinone oxidoreductase subunit NuoN [Vitreimonas sp.]HYD85874.1 NADH-quinone oxidoreductase subunit NuoN [Vitreimonas sp.]
MNAMSDLSASLPLAYPELLLAGFALAAAIIGAWLKDSAFNALSMLGIAAIVGAGVLALYGPFAPVEIFQGAMVVDGVAVFAKALIAFSGAATLALGWDHFAKVRDPRFEYPVVIALAVLGMFVMVSAQDLISLYVGVELQSLSAYVLAAWRRDDAYSSEAGLKYFVLSAISSGLLLFGSSFVYGFTGSIRFDAIAAAIGEGAGGVGLVFGLVLMLCALGFKMSAAPFHMWTPDVYEGAPTPVTAFFAAAPKVAAVALMVRVLYEPFAELQGQWQQVVAALAAISMVWGSVAALMQTNLKRLMAYSSISNIGFALMGVASGGEAGASSALIYMALYLPANVGIFALILAMRREGAPAETVADLAGMAQKRPWMASLFTMLLFSIAGIPPFAGFIGKLVVFSTSVQAGLIWLAVLGAVAAVVAAAYYLRLIASIWFAPPAAQLQAPSGTIMLTATAAAALTFPVLVLILGAVQGWAQDAVRMSF